MVLVRTIIFKLILIICSASSADVIKLKVSKSERYAMSSVPIVWLTEDRPFHFNIKSDAELNLVIQCLYGREQNIFQKIMRLSKNYVYVSRDVFATKNMKGLWKCRVYFSSGSIQEFSLKVDLASQTEDGSMNALRQYVASSSSRANAWGWLLFFSFVFLC